MIRPSYRANLAGDNGNPFFALVFKPTEEGKADPDDMRDGARAPRRFVGWQTFFDFGDGQVKPNKKIDTNISSPMFTLPLGVIASHDAPTALAQRTLMRHLTWQLPSGQAIARAMGRKRPQPSGRSRRWPDRCRSVSWSARCRSHVVPVNATQLASDVARPRGRRVRHGGPAPNRRSRSFVTRTVERQKRWRERRRAKVAEGWFTQFPQLSIADIVRAFTPLTVGEEHHDHSDRSTAFHGSRR